MYNNTKIMYIKYRNGIEVRFMDYITVIITAFVSLIVLFLLTKLIGNKQLSELTMFDYIVSITIGSIAAEMATELETPERPLIAMCVYAFVSFGISILVSKSIKLRRLLFGHSLVLMRTGKLYRKNFKKANLDLNEFLMQARLSGYFDLSAIDTAIMEASGKISFMPYAAKRPATPEDMNLVPNAEAVFFNVIMDGDILYKNLQYAGRDLNWLNNELKVQGIKSPSEVFLAILDNNGTLNVFKNYDYEEKNDYYE